MPISNSCTKCTAHTIKVTIGPMFLKEVQTNFNEEITTIRGLTLKLFSLDQLKKDPHIREKFKKEYACVYHNARWAKLFDFDLEKDSLQHFMFGLFDGEELIAGRSLVVMTEEDPYWEAMLPLAEALKCKKALRGHNAFTTNKWRGKGLMKDIIKETNKFAYEKLHADYVLGKSSHCYAYALYQKLGACMFQPDVDSINPFLDPE